MRLDARSRLVIGGLLALALALRVATAVGLPNMVWPDEIFQSLEQAHRAAFGDGIVPWEFRAGTRSWIFPGVLAGVMKAAAVASSSPAVYLTACASVLALVSLLVVWACARPFLARGDLRGAALGAFMASVWFELVFFAPKALSEVIAGNLLVLGAVLVESHRREPDRVRTRDAIAIAGLLGGALLLRVQLAPAALIALAFALVRVPTARKAIAIMCGALAMFYGLVDFITWDYPFQSVVENVRSNIVEGKSAQFGTSPWHAYLGVFASVWGVWTVLVVGLAVFGARRAPVVAIVLVATLLAHVAIAHKEYRFAYPAIALVVVLAAYGAAELVDLVRARYNTRLAMVAACALAVLWSAASLVGANRLHQERTNIAITLSPPQWHWSAGRGGLLGMREIGADSRTCGVGLVGIPWFLTGGHAYLHRDVPILEIPTPATLSERGRHLNALLASRSLPEHLGPFVRGTCWEDACVYRREGGCDALPGYQLNDVLRERGE